MKRAIELSSLVAAADDDEPGPDEHEDPRFRSKRKLQLGCPLSLLVIIVLLPATVSIFLFIHRSDGSSSGPVDLSGMTTANETSKDSSATGRATTKCDYECQTDRMGHEVPLFPGQAICNQQFRFGLTHEGIFQWEDCDTDNVIELFDPSSKQVSQPVQMRLLPNATIEVTGAVASTVYWSRESKREYMQVTPCLSRPHFDCPYLHMHKPGNVVFNYIDSVTGKWIDRNIQRVYDDIPEFPREK